MENNDVAAEVLLLRVTEHVELGLVGPKNCSISGNAMQTDGRGLQKRGELRNTAAQRR
jgi:hypothetical protein